MMRRLTDKRRRPILAAVLLLILGGLVLRHFFFSPEIREFNHYSVTDFGLGERIDGINSAEELTGALPGYEYFTDERGSGLSSKHADTRYYLGEYAGRYCVIGFVSRDVHYSALSISIGDPELDSRTLLLSDGYRMINGAHNRCTASNGTVTVELGFTMGIVTEIAAFIED